MPHESLRFVQGPLSVARAEQFAANDPIARFVGGMKTTEQKVARGVVPVGNALEDGAGGLSVGLKVFLALRYCHSS